MTSSAKNPGLRVALLDATAAREAAERALAAANAEHDACARVAETLRVALEGARVEAIHAHHEVAEGVAALRFARETSRAVVDRCEAACTQQDAVLRERKANCASAQATLTQRRTAERAIEIALERRAAATLAEEERRASDV